MLRRPEFTIDIRAFRKALQSMAVNELPVVGGHSEALFDLPDLHRDPFDHLLAAQSLAEPMSLWTNDRMVAQYSDSVILVS